MMVAFFNSHYCINEGLTSQAQVKLRDGHFFRHTVEEYLNLVIVGFLGGGLSKGRKEGTHRSSFKLGKRLPEPTCQHPNSQLFKKALHHQHGNSRSHSNLAANDNHLNRIEVM